MTSESNSELQSASQSQHHRRHHRSRHSFNKSNAEIAGEWIRDNGGAIGLVTALALGLLAEMPWIARSGRAHLLQFIVVGLFGFLAVLGLPRRLKTWNLAQGASPWILGILVWSVFLLVFPPSRGYGVSQILQPFAIGEFLRLLFCFGIYYAAAYWLRRTEVPSVAFGLLGLGALVALYGFVTYSSESSVDAQMTSIFGNHEQAGTYIMLLFLIPLALAISAQTDVKSRTAGQIFTLILGASLMVARTRSAWLGTLMGVIVLLALNLRYSPVKLTAATKYLLIGPLLIMVIGFGALACSGEIGPLLTKRASSFSAWTGDASFSQRLHRWQAACFMTHMKPITGWGLGAFPVIQERFTQEGDTPDQVLKHGTGHTNLAHNYYVQWASETGCVGLFLYVGALCAGLFCLLPVAGRQTGTSLTLLLGMIAALAAAAIDMLGAPSYTFPGASALPWLWMGLGVTLARPPRSNHRSSSEPDTEGEEAVLGTPAWVHYAAAGAGIVAVAIVLWAGRG